VEYDCLSLFAISVRSLAVSVLCVFHLAKVVAVITDLIDGAGELDRKAGMMVASAAARIVREATEGR
jgi:hypothetical protein